MALVRPLDVDCRWNYIYFAVEPENTICVQGLGYFDVSQFMALVKAYPRDFPEDITDRLIREMSDMLKRYKA